MLSSNNEIITSSSSKTDDLKKIDKAIEKLKIQEKRLVDLYFDNKLGLKIIKQKNDTFKNELSKLNNKKLDCTEKMINYFLLILKIFLYDLLSKKAKRDMIHRLISIIEIKRDKNFNINIKNIKFTHEFIIKRSRSKYDILSIKNENLNQIEWTKLMNNYKNMTEEIILNEYIYL